MASAQGSEEWSGSGREAGRQVWQLPVPLASFLLG